VVRDPATGAVLAEVAASIGVATNNVAEYSGLLAGLRAAKEVAPDAEVEVRMDSKLVVEQMSGRWKIKHPALQPLALEAQRIARRFTRIGYEWIPRERNKHADRLANEAMDAQAGIAPGKAERAEAPAPARWTGATGAPTRFLLLRHGQTTLSVERRYSGHGDHPLTELGVRQAKAAARRLSTMDIVDASTPIVSSPLGRAKQTAQAVAEATGGSVITHPGLIETDFGAWEGLTFAEVRERWPADLNAWLADPDAAPPGAARDPEIHRAWVQDSSKPPPGGESFDAVHRRVRRVRDELITTHGAATIIVVSHVTPIKSLLRMGLDAGPSLLFRLHLDIAALSIVEFYPDGNASVRLVNDTSYL
jgi:probable phosphoglycerate mutase